MATRFIERSSELLPSKNDYAGNVAAIHVDSDDEKVKFYDRTADVVRTLEDGREQSEVVTTTNVLTASESGKTFYLSSVDGFTTTLPAPALGLKFRFVVKTAPTEASYVIDTGAANIIYGVVHTVPEDDAGVAVAAQQKLNLVVDVALIGDWLELRSDGTNYYVSGGINVVEALTVAQS